MELHAALDVKPGDLVAFVGAGGKTTAIWQSLRSLVAHGERVVFTTTTHIFKPRQAPLLIDSLPDPALVAFLLTRWPAIILAAGLDEEGDPQMAARCPYPATPLRWTSNRETWLPLSGPEVRRRPSGSPSVPLSPTVSASCSPRPPTFSSPDRPRC